MDSKVNNRKLRYFRIYITFPVMLMLIGLLSLYLLTGQAVVMAKAQLNMIITKGAPSYPNEYDKSILKFNLTDIDLDNNIPIPSLNTHYANITCDRIGLEAPIYYGDTDAILLKGVGQYSASGLPGQGVPILIGGHDNTYFAPLEKVMLGDIFKVETNYGVFQYKVIGDNIADALDQVAFNLSNTEEELILYTCYPFGKLVGERNQRYFVYCEKISR